MTKDFGTVRQKFADMIEEKGNENLAQSVQVATSSQLTSDNFVQALKVQNPEFSTELETLKEEVRGLQADGKESFDPRQYFEATSNGDKFIANKLAKDIENDYEFRHLEDSNQLFVFQEGYYQDRGRQIIREECNRRLRDEISRRRVKEVLGIVEDRCFTKRYEFRPPERMINFENGTYDLEDEELKEHDPEHNFSYKLPIEYPDTPPSSDKIDEFLESIVETDGEVKTLKEIAGYLLLPDYPINKSFILVGQGNNGKSRYIDLLKNLIGHQNYANKSLHELEENRFSTQKLYGKLACFDDDLPSDRIRDSNKIKKLTGGSDVGAEVKYGGQFDFKNFAKLVFATNEMPRTSDNSDGFFRRWVIVDFPYKFKTNPDPENEEHKQAVPRQELMDNITDEEQLKGFVWEVVEDLKDVISNDEFTYAKEPDQVRRKWREYSVPMVSFIEKFVKQGVTYTEAENSSEDNKTLNEYEFDYVRKDTLQKLIGDYCENRSHSKPSKKAIKRALDETDLLYGIKRTRNEPDDKQVPVYSGLRLELDEQVARGVQGCTVSDQPEGQACAHIRACMKCSNQSMHTPHSSDSDSDTPGPSSLPESSDSSSGSVDSVNSGIEQMIVAKIEELNNSKRTYGPEIQEVVEDLPLEDNYAADSIRNLMRDGVLFEPTQGHVKVI